MPSQPVSPPAVRLLGIGKRFPGVRALADVTFDVRHGEIHALLGENGAGKSTLVKILAGLEQPDHGRMEVDGVEVVMHGPRQARSRGITVIPQEILVVPRLTVGRNITLGLERPLARKGRLSTEEHATVQHALLESGARFSAGARAESLSVPELREAQIARALIQPGDVILCDEPTAVLSEADADRLLERLRAFRLAGKAIIYVSHRLSEVLQIADRVTVLRDGRVVGTFERSDVDRDRIIDLMTRPDRAIPDERAHANSAPERPSTPTLEVEGVTSGRMLREVSMTAQAGEIVGVAGVQGSGHGYLLRVVAGLDRYDRGRIAIGGAGVVRSSIRASYRAGAIYLPADRARSATVPRMSIRGNLAVPVHSLCKRFGVRVTRQERQMTRRYIEALGIRAPSVESTAGGLSGGNQQKLAIARALESKPRLLLLEEPTQGIDINSKAEIRRLLYGLARTDGLSIVVATSEFEELLGLADRIYVMCLGRLVTTLTGEEATYTKILHHALP